MGKQDRGDPLKKEIGSSNECFRCGDGTDDNGVLCNQCKRMDGRSYLLTGDTPILMIFALIIVTFMLSYSGPEQIFAMKGVDISGKYWGMLFMSVSGIFLLVKMVFNRRSLKDDSTYRSLFRSITPMLVLVPISYLLVEFRSPVDIIIPGIFILIGCVSVFLNRKVLKVTPRSDMVLLSIFIIISTIGILYSFRGERFFLSLSFLPSFMMASIGLIGIFIFVIRVNSRAPISSRASMVNIMIILNVSFTFLLVLLGERTFGSDIMKFLWFLDIMFLVYSISFSLLKRSMDGTFISSYMIHEKQNSKILQEGNKIPSSYKLYSIDNAISNNPIHGFGDTRENGNPLFRIEGDESKATITNPQDEYITAHCEKGRLLASRGRFNEALKEYRTAISEGPQYHRTFYHMAVLRSSIPGRSKEAVKDLDMFLASRRSYISRLVENGLPEDYLYVFNDLYELYEKAIEDKLEILSKMGSSGDIWSYFTLVRDD